MSLLWNHLQRLPHRDLRGIATRLSLRKADANQKEAWVQAIHQFLLSPAAPPLLVRLLSPSAHMALQRLLAVDTLPTALFLAEYGPIRRPGVKRTWTPPPWRQPASVSEELYYAGLLHPQQDAAIERSRQVTIPADLRRHLRGQIVQYRIGVARPFPLLHDLARVLFYLRQHPGLALLHGRWLARRHLVQLNQRLLQPAPSPLLSHKAADRLGFLFFLARAAGLAQGPTPTAFAWSWLAEPPAQQLTLLWQAWLDASLELRSAYNQPGSYLPAPWPHLLVQHLASLPPPFSPSQVTDRILSAAPAFQGFFLAHMENLSQLEALIGATLAGPLSQLSLVTPWAPEGDSSSVTAPEKETPLPSWYVLTAAGRWLLQPTLTPPPEELAAWPTGVTAEWTEIEADLEMEPQGWLLSIPVTAAPDKVLPLAPFVEHLTLDASGPTPVHRLRLDADHLARAAAQGHKLLSLVDGLVELGVDLTAADLARLARWHEGGRQLSLHLLPVLRARTPESLKAVLEDRRTEPVIAELLTPTLAVLALPWEEARSRLAQAGLHVLSPLPAVTDGSAEELHGQDAAARPEEDVEQAAQRLEPGAVWLMGQVYALLSRHLPLPPPPFQALAALYAALPPGQQAALDVQLRRIQEDVEGLLDGLVFTPPPHPSEPDHWRSLIEQAMETGGLLKMDYFVAGRNLLTHRLVQPHFLEEKRGVLYMRAYCHAAGRVLRFRLDRIQGLHPVEPSITQPDDSDGDGPPPAPA